VEKIKRIPITSLCLTLNIFTRIKSKRNRGNGYSKQWDTKTDYQIWSLILRIEYITEDVSGQRAEEISLI